jgi:hypothetical protein
MLRGKLKSWRGPGKAKAAIRTPDAGTRVTFRAELMPGREPVERTFEVARVLVSGRLELVDLTGQHTMTEFEPLP